MTSKCGKKKEVAHELQMSVSLMFVLHFDFFCDLLLNRPIVAWNLFVLYNEERRKNDIHILALYRLAFCGLVLV